MARQRSLDFTSYTALLSCAVPALPRFEMSFDSEKWCDVLGVDFTGIHPAAAQELLPWGAEAAEMPSHLLGNCSA